MSNRRAPVRASICSSSTVSRSARTVARPARWSSSATARLRGLWRPLPLPWANSTTPSAGSGTTMSASSMTPAVGIWRLWRTAGMAGDLLHSALPEAPRIPRSRPGNHRRADRVHHHQGRTPTARETTMTATGELLARLTDNATVRRVYGEPYQRDGITVIPAAEIRAGAGLGRGSSDQPQTGEGEGGGVGLT